MPISPIRLHQYLVSRIREIADEDSMFTLTILLCCLKCQQSRNRRPLSFTLDEMTALFADLYPLMLIDISAMLENAEMADNGFWSYNSTISSLQIKARWKDSFAPRYIEEECSRIESMLAQMADEFENLSWTALPLVSSECQRQKNCKATGDVLEWVSPAYKGVFSFEAEGLGNIREVKKGAFYSCSQITAIVLPPTIRVIRSGAFFGCTKLSHIEGMENVVRLERRAFERTDISLATQDEWYFQYDANLFIDSDSTKSSHNYMGLQWDSHNKCFSLDGNSYSAHDVFKAIEEKGKRIGFESRSWSKEQLNEVAMVLARCLYENDEILPDNLILSHNIESLIKENLRELQSQNKDDSGASPLMLFHNEATINFSCKIGDPSIIASYDEVENERIKQNLTALHTANMTDILAKEICLNKYGVEHLTLLTTNGLYKGEPELSYELRIAGIEYDTIVDIAKDICRRFLQDSVLVKYQTFGLEGLNTTVFLLHVPLMNARKLLNAERTIVF